MNWKTLLVVASLALSTGLTACNNEAKTPDATKTETTETKTETKSDDGMKPADGAKTDAPKDSTTKKTEIKTTETKPK